MARKKANIHYIYKTTCNVTGRWYVGMHSTSNLEDGYMGSGKILRYSIRKYGVENHTKEILEFFETREILILREIEIVNKELISDGKCMNLKEGGTGGFTNKEHMIMCSKAGGQTHAKRLLEDEVYRNKMSLKSSATLKKAHKEGKFLTSLRFNGKTHSDKTKKLISEKMRGIGVGEINSQYGTCWITKDKTNKKVKKEDLETYLKEGWVKGREL